MADLGRFGVGNDGMRRVKSGMLARDEARRSNLVREYSLWRGNVRRCAHEKPTDVNRHRRKMSRVDAGKLTGFFSALRPRPAKTNESKKKPSHLTCRYYEKMKWREMAVLVGLKWDSTRLRFPLKIGQSYAWPRYCVTNIITRGVAVNAKPRAN